MNKKRILVLVLCFLAGACAINPVTGKKELSLISEQQEIALGKQTDGEIRSQYGIAEDAGISGYVAATGREIVPHTHRPNLIYHFAVLDSPVINAFAAPGGYIYVTRGVLFLMKSEVEMSAVLGHELGHVSARHSVRKLSQALIVQAGLAVGSALSDTFAKISGIAGIGIQLLFLKFSRDDEREADALGVQYSRSTGYDPGRMIDFFGALEKMGDLSGKSSLPGFLSTHPLTSERIRNVRGLLQAPDGRLIERDETYLRKIEGLIYGEDPRHGYVEKNAFVHPQLRFSCSIPEGWEVQNTPSRVTFASKDKEAAVVIEAEKSVETLAAYAKKKNSSLEGGQLVQTRDSVVHGFSCFHQIFDIANKNKEAFRLRYSFIRKGDEIYTFSALSATANFKRHEAEFDRIVNTFEEVKDAGRLNRRPLRLKLVKSDGIQSLQKIFEKSSLKKDLWEKFSVMNGIGLSEIPSKGRLIKVVQ